MRKAIVVAMIVVTLALAGGQAAALNSPWIGITYFYWYTWDYAKHMGGWIGGVYNTPLFGYYDSRSYADNFRELHCSAEWGITHNFMDFWGQGWLDNKGRPRETCVMDAAEAVRREGYDEWMSFYQDGTDFQMDDFAKNMDPGRQVQWMVKNYPKSKVWPKIDGKPVWLVYGRNGSPKITATNQGFQQWLQAKYGTLDKLDAAWFQKLTSWKAATFAPDSQGVQRADSIRYQYALWAKSIAAMNAKVKNGGYGFPGIMPSFDIAYKPYHNWGYSLETKTFCGPHSYGGIFGQPQDQDVQRYIQAAVAKWYGNVFFDTYKNYYHDWEIRIPGMVYPPNPYHFDCFWTIALAHYAEALLHLSWNEWWEGSNMEPSWEYGKTYPEKNLLYATVMKASFDSIKRAQTQGSVAVLLNDWQWLVSGAGQDDIYGTIQALRAENVDFKLLPDDFVTAKNLADVRVVFAPGAGVGFGQNAEGQQITDVLKTWLAGGANRKLVVSALPGPSDALPADAGSAWRQQLGLKRAAPLGSGGPTSINALVDVGAKGDDSFLLSGYSGPEDWAKLPGAAYGAGQKHTVRWTPGSGTETKMLLPVAPRKANILTFAGNAAWPNEVDVIVNTKTVGHAVISTGDQQFKVTVPAAVIGPSQVAVVTLRYKTQRVPNIETAGKNNDNRVCDFALDWVRIHTADQTGLPTPAVMPEAKVRYNGALQGIADQTIKYWPSGPLAAAGADIVSRYTLNDAPRDMLLAGGKIWYCNGLLGRVDAPAYWDAILKWAAIDPTWAAKGDHAIGARLQAGSTTILPVYSTDITKSRPVLLEAPAGKWPLAEAQIITRDGSTFQPLQTTLVDGKIRAVDNLHYYGLYQMTECPVRPEDFSAPDMAAGVERVARFSLANLTRQPVHGRVTLRSWLPSLTAPWVNFSADAGGATVVSLPITARSDLDWGRKTVALVVDVGGKDAFFWRPLTVVETPTWHVDAAGVGNNLMLGLSQSTNKWATQAPAKAVEIWADGKRVPRAQRRGFYGAVGRQALGDGVTGEVEVHYTLFGQARVDKVDFPLPPPTKATTQAPTDALAAVVIPRAGARAGDLIATMLRTNSKPSGAVVLRDTRGREAPAAIIDDKLTGLLPSNGPGPFFVCPSRKTATDLRVQRLADGRIRVSNSQIAATFDPAKGGTITDLRWRGGRNMAQNSFGASWGQWGKFDPLHPATTATVYLAQEKKIFQWQGPATVTVERKDAFGVIVGVRQVGPQFVINQTYSFYAYLPYFSLDTTVQAQPNVNVDEIAVIDASLERGPWNKIFPNFTGVFTGKPALHGGWRQSPYIPPCATIMTEGTWRNSLSFVSIATSPQVNWWRQGFFPRHRGEVGDVDTARLELVARREEGKRLPTTPISAGVVVLFHDGYQTVAQDATARPTFVNAWQVPITGRKKFAGAKIPGDWWCQAWNARAKVTTKPLVLPVSVAIPLGAGGRWLDPKSVVAVLQGRDGSMALPSHAIVQPDGDLAVHIDKPAVKIGEGTLYVYARTSLERPALPKLGAAGVPDPSFEKDAVGWSLGAASVEGKFAHTGHAAVKLFTDVDNAFSLASTDQIVVRPNSSYMVSFWARGDAPKLFVNVNFFGGADYDFGHTGTAIKGDGQWHEYHVKTPTGAFPFTIQPALRLWVYKLAGPVYIDDVSIKAIKEPVQAAPRATVEFLR